MRPSKNDYAEYYDKYISRVPGDDIIGVLNNYPVSIDFLRAIKPDKEDFAYADGKWTVKQVIGHIIDTERIMAYRALRISRNDKQSLPGFNQEEFIKYGNAQRRKLDNLVDEFEAVRKSNLILFKSFTEEEFQRRGTASGYEVSVNALLYIIAGHELHHLNILKERYL
jgi:hypothetical protein